jgi:hypothetical protein
MGWIHNLRMDSRQFNTSSVDGKINIMRFIISGTTPSEVT